MQANPFGFNVAANPCEGGSCDPVSQCKYDMAVEGKEKYGENAYGPNGTLIDTNQPFNVHTEFLSTSSYASLWGLRTKMTQNGNEILLETNCDGYINSLGGPIEGGMGLVLSSWDNRSYDFGNWECQGSCP